MRQGTLSELDAVLTVARRGAFRAAALELGMSPTALSRTIRELEARLGVRMFNRTTRSVSLTDAGRRFAAEIGPAIETIRGAMETARSQRDAPSGLLRINAAPVAAREILAPLILEFLRRYPEVEIDLVTEGRLVDVVGAGFDLGVRTADLVPADMIRAALGPSQCFAVVAAPGYIAAHGAPQTPADLLAHACVRVRLPDGALFRWRFERHGAPLRIDVPGRLTLDEATLVREAVLRGTGIGYLMASTVAEDIALGRLVPLLADWIPELPGLCLYYASRRDPSAAMRAFLALAREISW